MSARSVLVDYRDDGPLAELIAGALGRIPIARAAAGGPLNPPLAWLVPPVLRATEYGLLLRLAMRDGGQVQRCYAVLAAVAYHHYDVVYRIRTRGSAPPDWLRRAGGGWDGRLLAAAWLFRTGRLEPAMPIAAAALGGLFVTESIGSWLAGSQRQSEPGRGGPDAGIYADDESDEE